MIRNHQRNRVETTVRVLSFKDSTPLQIQAQVNTCIIETDLFVEDIKICSHKDGIVYTLIFRGVKE